MDNLVKKQLRFSWGEGKRKLYWNQWVENHKEHFKACQKRWYHQHRERQIAISLQCFRRKKSRMFYFLIWYQLVNTPVIETNTNIVSFNVNQKSSINKSLNSEFHQELLAAIIKYMPTTLTNQKEYLDKLIELNKCEIMKEVKYN